MIETNAPELGKIIHFPYTFKMGLECIAQKEAELVSNRDLAYVRIYGDNRDFASLEGFTKEGSVFGAHKATILIRESRTPRHLNDKYDNVNRAIDTISEEEYQIILKKAEQEKTKPVGDRSSLILPYSYFRENFGSVYIPTDSFAEHDLTLWLYLNVAKEYGLFLKKEGFENAEFAMLSLPVLDTGRKSAQEVLGEDFPHLDLPKAATIFSWGRNRGFRTDFDLNIATFVHIFGLLRKQS